MKVFWFDVETSGLDPDRHGIIQLAYVIEIDGEIEEHGVMMSNCTQKEINASALEVNGYTQEQIQAHPTPVDMYQALSLVLSRYVDKYDRSDKFVMGGYNVGFDAAFLRKLWDDCGDRYFGSWFGYGTVDPSQIVRFLQYAGILGEQTSMRLADLADMYGVRREVTHDALEDIQMTIDVVNAMRAQLFEAGQ